MSILVNTCIVFAVTSSNNLGNTLKLTNILISLYYGMKLFTFLHYTSKHIKFDLIYLEQDT